MQFKAKTLFIFKLNGVVDSKEVVVESVDDIKSLFKPHDADVIQVNIDKYSKVYFSTGFFTADGIDAIVDSQDGGKSYCAYPLLLVKCDDEKPIDIDDEHIDFIKSKIDFV